MLSGNTDLLDKAKLEKRIASLEGERKSVNKGKRDSEFKLESKTGELRNNTAFIEAMTEDWNRFLSVVQTDKEGSRLNLVKVDGVDSTDEKVRSSLTTASWWRVTTSTPTTTGIWRWQTRLLPHETF